MYVILWTSFKLILRCLRFYIIADQHNLIHIVLADYLWWHGSGLISCTVTGWWTCIFKNNWLITYQGRKQNGNSAFRGYQKEMKGKKKLVTRFFRSNRAGIDFTFFFGDYIFWLHQTGRNIPDFNMMMIVSKIIFVYKAFYQSHPWFLISKQDAQFCLFWNLLWPYIEPHFVAENPSLTT